LKCAAWCSIAATLSGGEDVARDRTQLAAATATATATAAAAAAAIVDSQSDAITGLSADLPDHGHETAAHESLQIGDQLLNLIVSSFISPGENRHTYSFV
jgi:hypothetical protein